MGKLVVFDGNSILNRAYYGVRQLTAPDGLPTNAVYGFVNIILKMTEQESPTAVAVAFDTKAPTFRHKACDTYKANRKGMPDELAVQLPYAKEAVRLLGYTVVECPGYEADDILGTLAASAEADGCECILVTGDRDSFQLVTDSVKVFLAANTETKVYDTARILSEYGVSPAQLIDVKAIMGDTSDNIKGVPGIGEKGALALISEYGSLDGVYSNLASIKENTQKKLSDGRDSAYESYFLARINTAAPIDTATSSYSVRRRDDGRLHELLERLGFRRLIERLWPGGFSPSALPDEHADKAQEDISFSGLCETDSAGLASKDGGLDAGVFFGDGDVTVAFSDGSVLRCPLDGGLAGFFSRGGRRLVLWSIKEAVALLRSKGMELSAECEDISLISYILSPTGGGRTFAQLTDEYPSLSKLPEAQALLRLYDPLRKKLEDNGQVSLYTDIEKPLAYLLADMERDGFGVDADGLRAFGSRLESAINEAERGIYLAAGESFNINSPKQLGAVLFDKLKLPHYKKTKQGYSTGADVLEKLRDRHPIIDMILYYRQLSKLKSTYADGLLKVIDPSDGRIHTTFRQTLTQTGRLSSVEPNLQNIPVRSGLGKTFRRFFVAAEGKTLVDADYSQIELRILAHMSGDETLIDAFCSGADIHTITASQVFGVPPELVSGEMRKRAKAVNFGIIYGIGDYSLSEDIGVSMREAKEYIESYFAKYPKIKEYMDGVKAQAKRDGYVTTIFGRRRYIPELSSGKKPTVAFGERVAMNTPIQGSAADIIKKAMIDVAAALREAGLAGRLILQIHDELIVESPAKEAARAAGILKECMESAVKLKVPLVADTHTGHSWYDAKGGE